MRNRYLAARCTHGHGLYRLGSLLLALLVTGSLCAKPLPMVPVLPLDLAHKAVRAAVAACSKDGYRVSAAIVNRSGVLKAFARADGAGAHTVDSARHKAYTAASLREPTAKLAGLIAKHPELQALRDMNESILILAGGLPIRIDGQFVGGIGVGGAPGGELDEGCARAGLAAIGAETGEP
ncbi:MAG: heme-binding protein [Nitrococcus sp.]|nr:heme-binding protein [Nitrococcus sp.]